MATATTTIHWFRKDLRLTDNPALSYAAKNNCIAVFIFDENAPHRPTGAASSWWLHHSLKSLAADLAKIGIPLILKRGAAADILPKLAAQFKSACITANRRYESTHIAEESRLNGMLGMNNIEFKLFDGNLLHDPFTHRNGQGNPYQVYTPFWKSVVAAGEPTRPVPAPQKQNHAFDDSITAQSERIEDWKLLPEKPDWAKIIAQNWRPGSASAQSQLDHFLNNAVVGYKENRNRPDMTGTSRLSPHLHWGEISPREIWHRTAAICHSQGKNHLQGDAEVFLKELVWREFSYHLLVHYPKMATDPLRAQFRAFPWRENKAHVQAWKKGLTGYPIVDAGMRELWQTGWMHNRVRMIAASFLIKHLLTDWRRGEEWFWDTLVDADPASNTASWQWVAGCGADAAPYFRIFNPILQGEKFDASGDYVKKYVPELSKLPPEFVHKPWEAPPILLAECGVILGKTYPHPIVDHNKARAAALAALAETKIPA